MALYMITASALPPVDLGRLHEFAEGVGPTCSLLDPIVVLLAATLSIPSYVQMWLSSATSRVSRYSCAIRMKGLPAVGATVGGSRRTDDLRMPYQQVILTPQ